MHKGPIINEQKFCYLRGVFPIMIFIFYPRYSEGTKHNNPSLKQKPDDKAHYNHMHQSSTFKKRVCDVAIPDLYVINTPKFLQKVCPCHHNKQNMLTIHRKGCVLVLFWRQQGFHMASPSYGQWFVMDPLPC